MDRRTAYFWLMGTCLALIVLAWFVVRFFSIPVAVGMSVVAALIPPVAAIVANWRGDRWAVEPAPPRAITATGPTRCCARRS